MNIINWIKNKGSSDVDRLDSLRLKLTIAVLVPVLLWILFNIAMLGRANNPSEKLAFFLSYPVNFVVLLLFSSAFLYRGYIGLVDILAHSKLSENESLLCIVKKTLAAFLIFTHMLTVSNLIFYYIILRYSFELSS